MAESDSPIDRRKEIVFDDPSFIGAESDLYHSLLSARFSSGIDLATQVSLEVIDPDFKMARNNYFQITRDVYVKTTKVKSLTESLNTSTYRVLSDVEYQRLEIAAASCAPGRGSSPVWTLECRSKPIQQMRRDKDPSSISGNGQNFAINAGKKFDLPVVAQATSKTRTINKASNDRAADSTWDVLSSLANDAKFVVFETDSILFFASQKYMIGLWGAGYAKGISADIIAASGAETRNGYNVCPMRFPSHPDDIFQLVQMPQMRRSDNDPLFVQGSASVDRSSGTALRPGMTVYISNYPTFEGMYLISQVDYNILDDSPVQIQFRSPEREAKDITNYGVGQTFTPSFIERGF